MANLKNIADLPVAESAKGLNLIAEQDGAAKRVAVDAVCKVKTVNGVGPDAKGNVEVDALPDNTEQIEMLIEADMLPAVHDASGSILTDENGNIILRY